MDLFGCIMCSHFLLHQHIKITVGVKCMQSLVILFKRMIALSWKNSNLNPPISLGWEGSNNIAKSMISNYIGHKAD